VTIGDVESVHKKLRKLTVGKDVNKKVNNSTHPSLIRFCDGISLTINPAFTSHLNHCFTPPPSSRSLPAVLLAGPISGYMYTQIIRRSTPPDFSNWEFCSGEMYNLFAPNCRPFHEYTAPALPSSACQYLTPRSVLGLKGTTTTSWASFSIDTQAYIFPCLPYKKASFYQFNLAMNSNHLFIEAYFLDKHSDAAQRKYHLTAR